MESKDLVFKSEDVSFADFVNKLIRENEGSHFFSDCFDDAIIGINEETKSIVYSLDKLVELEINLRFEEGALNPEYDDDIDNDILIVCQDSILSQFQMFHCREEGVIPTLFDETTESVYDPTTAAAEISTTIESVLGNEVCRESKKLDMPSKEFSFGQLDEIVTANEAEYLRFIELRQFNPESSFELIPRELLDFDDDEPIIRTVVKLIDRPYWLGFQDLTFDQWERGKVVDGNQDAA